MKLKLFFICAVLFVEANTECGDYLACLSELVHGFFGTTPRNSTINDNINKNQTDLYEINGFNNNDLDRILNQVSSIVKSNVTGDIIDSKSKTAEFMNDKTKVLIKIFEFDKPKDVNSNQNGVTTKRPENFVTISSVTETPVILTSTEKEFPLTTDIIHQVNDMAVSMDNLEDNLILSDDAYVDLDNNTDYPNINYIEIYKDATVEYIEFMPTELPVANSEDAKVDKDTDNLIEYSANEEMSLNALGDDKSGAEAVFPWITTIFVKNDSKDNQFEYYCDGALINNRFLLTAGRCVNINNSTMKADNLLIVLGKKSLHAVGEEEKVHKVKTIKFHENFTVQDGGAENDLAILELDEPAILNGVVQSAIFVENDSYVDKTATTAWGFTGDLTPIVFNKKPSETCNSGAENTFCATYANDVALCPSYGGLHIVKQTDKWYLRGIRTGDPEQRGICINRDVVYTDLFNYKDWIKGVIG